VALASIGLLRQTQTYSFTLKYEHNSKATTDRNFSSAVSLICFWYFIKLLKPCSFKTVGAVVIIYE
jgi:hypothetical protein